MSKNPIMKRTALFPSDPLEMYRQYGFAVERLYDDIQVSILEKFAAEWLYRPLPDWTSGREDTLPLEKYHVWSKSPSVDHGGIFRSQSRRMTPGLGKRL